MRGLESSRAQVLKWDMTLLYINVSSVDLQWFISLFRLVYEKENKLLANLNVRLIQCLCHFKAIMSNTWCFQLLLRVNSNIRSKGRSRLILGLAKSTVVLILSLWSWSFKLCVSVCLLQVSQKKCWMPLKPDFTYKTTHVVRSRATIFTRE